MGAACADARPGENMRLRSLFAIAALLPMVSARAAQPVPVVATFSIIADILQNVGGDHIAIATIVGPDGDSEQYQPTTADVGKVAAARAVFLNDLNEEFEPWLEPLLKQAGFTGEKVVVSRHVHTLTSEEEHPISGRQLPATIDQHAWMDPENGVIYVRNIAAALEQLDPGDAADYTARAADYIKRIRTVDAWAKDQIASVPPAKRRVLTSHDSLEYITTAYGITLLSVNGWTNKSEPSAAELAKLAQRIRAGGVKALFLDSITDPRTTQRIAGETGARIGGTLYGDSLSAKGGEADSYLNLLRHDVVTLKIGMLLN